MTNPRYPTKLRQLAQYVEHGVASHQELFTLRGITKNKRTIDSGCLGMILHEGLKRSPLQRCKQKFLIPIFLQNEVNRPIAKATDSVEKEDRLFLHCRELRSASLTGRADSPLHFEIVDSPFPVIQ